MFTRVEVQNFRSLRDVSVNLSNFHVLVGANGSGKTTFLDVFAFMGDVLRDGVQEAMRKRNMRWRDLVNSSSGSKTIRFAFEALIPETILAGSKLELFDSVRYEILIGFEWQKEQENAILAENGYLFSSSRTPQEWRKESANQSNIPNQILNIDSIKDFSNETIAVQILYRDGSTARAIPVDDLKQWEARIGWDVAALEKLQEDTIKFPVIYWFKNLFKENLQPINIESDAINKAGKEGRAGIVSRDGSNLPWIIDSLKKKYPDRYKRWLQHVRAALPEIKSIKSVTREDYGDKFLKIKYQAGHEVKQWMVSDGTLRILLLTIIPYDLDLQGLFLIEEPETGIYPQAIETVMDALRFIYAGQALITTHASGVVNSVKKKDLLLFVKNEHGETKIMTMQDNEFLRDWKGALSSAAFFSDGIIG
jgi:predicted ATPase